MEHLLRPSASAEKPMILIPYVCKDEYDGKDFLDYPSRIGLPSLQVVGIYPGCLSYADSKHLHSKSNEFIESFYQTWLFFGLVHEILGPLYDVNDFVSVGIINDSKVKVLSTSKLNMKLEQWVVLVQNGGVDPLLTYNHIAQCLRSAHATLLNTRPDFNQHLKVSLVSLAQNLGYATSKAFNVAWGDGAENNKIPLTWARLIDKKYWISLLTASGWCISQIDVMLDTSSSLSTLNFLACCNKTGIEERHSHCNRRQCTAYQNDPSNYQVRHRDPDQHCACEELRIEQHELAGILQSGSLPLIRIHDPGALSELRADLLSSQSSSRYVAISHVWADGLGNPRANALPRCQLSYLRNIVKRLKLELGTPDEQEDREILIWLVSSSYLESLLDVFRGIGHALKSGPGMFSMRYTDSMFEV